MVARLFVVSLAALLVSCTSVFDSYYPDSLEYLEAQADVRKDAGSQNIVQVHMQVLAATALHSNDLLAVVVDLGDGTQTVLFYDKTMKLLRSYSQARLTAANGGTVPDLYPIGQDGTMVRTGASEYVFPSSSPTLQTSTTALQPPLDAAQNNGYGLSGYKLVYYEDAANSLSFPVLFNPTGNTVQIWQNSSWTRISDISSSSVNVQFPASASFNNMLGVTCWNKKYYMVLTGGGSNFYLATTDSATADFSGGTFVTAQPKDSNGNNTGDGWATATAGVVRSHSDNASILTAFSWSGKQLGTLRIASDSDSVAFAFHPDGSLWYLYDPGTGKITQYRAWW